MQFGSRINGRLVNLPATLGLTKPGDIYEVYIDTQGIPDETTAIQQLLTLEQQVPDLKVLYVQTDATTNRIVLQFIDAGPGQFGLETVLMWLPQVLIIAGIVTVAMFLFGLLPTLQTLPSWIWYIAVIGGALLVGAWLTRGVSRPAEIAAVAREKREERARKTEIKRKETETEKEEEKAKEAMIRTDKQMGIVRELTDQVIVTYDKTKDCERALKREAEKARPSQRKMDALEEQCQKIKDEAERVVFRLNRETEMLERTGEKAVGAKASPAMIHEIRQIIKKKEKAEQDTSKEEAMLSDWVG